MRRLAGGMILLASLGLFSSTVHAEPDLMEPPADQLWVGGPLEMPPYAYLNESGVYTGFSVDMLRAAGERMGIDSVLFYPLPDESENLKELLQKKIDCIHFVRYSSTLAHDFLFADIYYESPSVLFVHVNRYDLTGLEDLTEKKIAISKEDPSYERLHHEGRSHLLPVEGLEEAFRLLREDQADAFIGERLTTLSYLGSKGIEDRFKIVGAEIARSRFGILIRRDQPELAARFKKAFRHLERSGERDRIFYQWFGENFHSQPLLARKTVRWMILFIGASLLVTIIVLGWNLLLQRELQLKAIAMEKVELDKKIAEEKSRFEAIVQSMTEGLMLVDPQGLIAYVNAPGANYLRRRIDDLMHHPISVLQSFLISKASDPELLSRKLENAELNPTRSAVVEYTATTTRRVDIRMKFFPVRDRTGLFAGRGVLIEDITHEREVERLKSEFVSIASHELRTPMTSILGFSELMLTQTLSNETVTRYTQQIHREAERLTRILNDMLDISFLESGEGILEKKPVSIVELIHEVVDNFRAQLNDRRVIRVTEHGLPGLIMVDRDKIVQVLWNLLSNAHKYSSEKKEILIDIIERRAPLPEWGIGAEELELMLPGVEIQITDYGQGIPEDQLSLIFIPFHRLETAVHTIRGTGLGLAIVKRIVEAHGGRVWAQSILGQQTVFSVLLPTRRS